MKTALITGATGQDGAYLIKFLLDRDYRVIGTFRRSSSPNFWRIEELGCRDHPNLQLLEFDLSDIGAAMRVIQKSDPDEIYNLAAQSFVGTSFEQPILTSEITGLGCLNLLEAIRLLKTPTKFYQASTSEMFGKVTATPQNETTPFYPRSPYGVAKLYAHWMVVNYREAYDMFGSSGILFNHESPLRGEEFVTRKITSSVAKIATGNARTIELGNLNARRDWGYAAEYVEGMWAMLQADKAGTFVLATNQSTSVRKFVELAFAKIDVSILWEGSGLDEIGRDKKTGDILVRVNPKYFRPAEVDQLIGDPTKAKDELGWEAKTTVEELCSKMVAADIKRIEQRK